MKSGYRAGFAALALACGLATGSADGATFKTLYSFCAVSGCPDGANPTSTLLMDASGNFYGTANDGGDTGNAGTVFEFVKSGKGWKYRRLYSFCAQASCADGSLPAGALIMDTAGDLYGTTYAGGAMDDGIVYELVPNATKKKWKLKVVHDFCLDGSCADGKQPFAGLSYSGAATGALYDGTSPLFGTTTLGGDLNGGTAFDLTPKGKKWNETVLFSFCVDPSCPAGTQPFAPLLVDGSGNLFGTTFENGLHNGGVIFELSQSAGKWSETVLYSFCAVTKCGDGDAPHTGALLMDGSGNIFGTTQNGDTGGGGGTLYKLKPNGVNSTLTTLYSFCSLTNCTDGQYPQGDLAMDSSGDLFGTTNMGGPNQGGEIYEFKTALSIAYAFCSQPGCGDGFGPEAGPILDGKGNIFGTTTTGSPTGNDGQFFELSH